MQHIRSVCLVVVLSAVVCLGFDLPSIDASGSPLEVGRSIGTTFRERIGDYIANYKNLQQVLLPFYNSHKGREIFDQFVEANSKAYPQYVEELAGIAEGASECCCSNKD